MDLPRSIASWRSTSVAVPAGSRWTTASPGAAASTWVVEVAAAGAARQRASARTVPTPPRRVARPRRTRAVEVDMILFSLVFFAGPLEALDGNTGARDHLDAGPDGACDPGLALRPAEQRRHAHGLGLHLLVVRGAAQRELEATLVSGVGELLGLLRRDLHRHDAHELGLAVPRLLELLVDGEHGDVLEDDLREGQLLLRIEPPDRREHVHPRAGRDEAGDAHDLVHLHGDRAAGVRDHGGKARSGAGREQQRLEHGLAPREGVP